MHFVLSHVAAAAAGVRLSRRFEMMPSRPWLARELEELAAAAVDVIAVAEGAALLADERSSGAPCARSAAARSDRRRRARAGRTRSTRGSSRRRENAFCSAWKLVRPSGRSARDLAVEHVRASHGSAATASATAGNWAVQSLNRRGSEAHLLAVLVGEDPVAVELLLVQPFGAFGSLVDQLRELKLLDLGHAWKSCSCHALHQVRPIRLTV